MHHTNTCGFWGVFRHNPQKQRLPITRIPSLHTPVHTRRRRKDPAYGPGHQKWQSMFYFTVTAKNFKFAFFHTASSPMTAEAMPPAAWVTTRSTPLLPLVASAAEAAELFRGTVGSRLDLQRGHQAWSGPSNQASMHCRHSFHR